MDVFEYLYVTMQQQNKTTIKQNYNQIKLQSNKTTIE